MVRIYFYKVKTHRLVIHVAVAQGTHTPCKLCNAMPKKSNDYFTDRQRSDYTNKWTANKYKQAKIEQR
jgi:hypothetical protein